MRAVNLLPRDEVPKSFEAKRGVVAACPVWSSGAYRYGNAMAAPVLVTLGL